ncbi:FHA domain-containing protein [Shewanella surugensis]|uniref:FHA domain-containing protein n=1 Tax=Shewanella surugensis TaxID=212020 RepID=A0ABT0L8Z2_9GAMM|nr:FHA domain-containing protein [Shewanella surugensis]MCL1123960.1 FHA domain-containing protein [Shewanella surugensis]
MAMMLNEATGNSVLLQPQHIFGRHPTAATQLTNLEASRTHAVIIWDGEYWILQDTSSNGTFINGKRLKKGHKILLEKGDAIQFGNIHTENWFIKELTPPESILLPLTLGLETIHLSAITALPSEDSPEVSIYPSAQGQWLCETSEGTVILKTGDCVGTAEFQWRFVDAKASIETDILSDKKPLLFDDICFIFDVSQNEEHVSLTLTLDETPIDLGERNHHYVLLLLARKSLEDSKLGVSDIERGWLDKDLLCGMLGQSENHINIHIYRFRKQLSALYPDAEQLSTLIERRTGEIRFSPREIEIFGGLTIDPTIQQQGKPIRLN